MKNSKLPVIILAVLLVVCVVGFVMNNSSNAAKIAELQDSETKLKGEVESLTADIATKEAENADLNSQIQTLNDEVASTNSELEDVNAKLDKKKTDLENELSRQDKWNAYIEPSRLLGEWTVVAHVDKEEDFDPNNSSTTGLWLKSAKFNERTVSFDMGEGYRGSSDWLDDCIFDENSADFMIDEIDGTEYLFYEWKSGDYARSNSISYYVFKKNN